jgi:ribulose-bisphosphate carboxylase large chain
MQTVSTPTLGQTLKMLLQEHDISAAELARRADLSVASLSRILNDQTNPSFDSVSRLAKALGIGMDAFTPEASANTAARSEVRPSAFPMEAVYILENTDHTVESAQQLLTQAAQGSWVNSWTHRMVSESIVQPEVSKVEQVGTRRLQVSLEFPHELLERGSLVSLLSVAGSALTGTGARLFDLRVPEPLLRTFNGPAFGGRGLRDTFNKHGRPMLACTIRPMYGLSPKMYGRAAYEALIGGVDMTADPTLMHSIPSNPWRERFRFVAEAAAAATRETNEFKSHAVNITAGTVEDMQERALWARDLELAMVMVDSAAIGWSALQSITAFCAKNELLICAMGGRALNGDMLSEQLQAKLLRFAGADVVSTGSPLRGNISNRRYVTGVLNALRDEHLPQAPDMGHYVEQPLAGLTGALPAVGGGHNPWHFARLMDAIGHDAVIQCGGAIMGHPQGSQAGANACRTALESLIQAQNEGQNLNVEGRHILQKAARYSPELKTALDTFQEGSFLFGVVQSAPRPTEGSVIPHGTNPSPTITPFRRLDAEPSLED